MINLRQKKKPYSLNIIWLIIIILTTFGFRIETSLGNPIPWDENWELSPIPINYSKPIHFMEEYIVVNFTETNAEVLATYSFKNLNDTSQSLKIYIPFVNYDNKSLQPEIDIIDLNGESIEYEWQELPINLTTIYRSTWGYEQFYLIELELNFEPTESKSLQIHYLRDYLIYNYPSNSEIHYEYRYFVGSLRLWSQPLISAKFEFWVPKSICDILEKPWNSERLGENFTERLEYDMYYFLRVIYENWTLPVETEDNHPSIYEDFIYVRWTKKKSGIFGTHYSMILGSFILITILKKKIKLRINCREKE